MVKCEVIQDLLPLYHDDVASEESRALIDSHISSCPDCQGILSKMCSKDEPTNHVNAYQAEIGALKTMKKKLLKKNVMVSLGSMVVLIALAVGIFNWVFLPQTPIPYEDGLLQVHVNITRVTYDESGNPVVITDPNSLVGTFDEREVLDIVSSRKTANKSAAYINIEDHGENVRLVFVNFTENLLAKWERGGETVYAFRIVEPHDAIVLSENGENIALQVIDRVEVYYINQQISEISTQNDYAKLRSDGKLIWSGTLK